MERMFKTREVDNLYIVIVTRGSNKEVRFSIGLSNGKKGKCPD